MSGQTELLQCRTGSAGFETRLTSCFETGDNCCVFLMKAAMLKVYLRLWETVDGSSLLDDFEVLSAEYKFKIYIYNKLYI